MSEKDVNAKRSLMNRFRNKRNIVSKSITTLIFALFMWHGRIDQLKGVPQPHHIHRHQRTYKIRRQKVE